MTSRLARISWLTADQGGRSCPPAGPRYSTPARFEANSTSWPEQAWSLVLDLVSHPAGTADWIANVHFLFPEAPHGWLSDGARFELFEGNRCVARGTILDAQQAANSRVAAGQEAHAAP